MKNLKKKLAGILIFAMVLGIMAPGMTAQAAEVTEPKFEVVYNSLAQTVAVSAAGIENYTVRFASTKTAGATPAEKDWYDAPNGVTDVSWVSPKKDAFGKFEISSGGSVVKTLEVKLDAQRSDLAVALINEDSADKVTISKKMELEKVEDDHTLGGADTGYLVFYTAKKGETKGTPVSYSSIEMKKGANGNWEELGSYIATGDADAEMAKILEQCLAKGTTLYFRMWENDSFWPSKEVKFSYKKQANAPKLKLDISKHTTGLKAGQEYRLCYEDFKSSWIFVNTEASHLADDSTATKVKLIKTGIQVEDLIVTGEAVTVTKGAIGEKMYDDGWTLEVRTAATSGKVPSKVAKYEIKTQEIASKDAIEVALVNPNDASKGLKITNETGKELQYTVLPSGSSIDGATKWTTIKAAADKPATFKKNFAKGATGVGDTDIIYVREAGTKAKKEGNTEIPAVLAGKYVTFIAGDHNKEIAVKGVTYGAVSATAIAPTGDDKTTINLKYNKSAVSGAAANVIDTFQIEFNNVPSDMSNSNVTVSDKDGNDAVTVAVTTVDKSSNAKVTVTVNKGNPESTDKGTYTFEFNGIEFTVEVEFAS